MLILCIVFKYLIQSVRTLEIEDDSEKKENKIFLSKRSNLLENVYNDRNVFCDSLKRSSESSISLNVQELDGNNLLNSHLCRFF